jgi:hypothetical protein
MFELKKYIHNNKSEWDAFVSISKNSTFLFHRDYMDYHADRFEDYSLMLYDKNTLVALLPANLVGDTVYSHQGLTYGGLILSKKYHYEDIQLYLNSINQHLSNEGIKTLVLKVPPYFYANNLAQELNLLLQRNEGIKTKTVLGAAISTEDFSFPKMSLSKTKLKLFLMEESKDLKPFWKILEQNLKERYGSSPVHSIEEIEQLSKKFPEQIKLFVFRHKNTRFIEAGVLLFINDKTIKTQYISSTIEGRKNRVSDALYYSVINAFKKNYQFIDFGTCEEENNTINMSLLNAKEKFGASAFPIYTHSFSTEKRFKL